MASTEGQYQLLVSKLRDISALESALSLFHWDQQTYMPKQGASGRASQVATLASVQHEKKNDPEIRDLVDALSTRTDLSPDERANVRLVRRELRRAWALPNQLVRAVASSSAKTHDIWLRAREQRSFDVVRDALRELVALKREYGDALLGAGVIEKDAAPFLSRYDALLDGYEPGARSGMIREIFSSLGTELRTLVTRITATPPPSVPEVLLHGPFPAVQQQQLVNDIVTTIGFDFRSGRMDETVHPFCSTIGQGDVRLCTKYDESNLFSGLFGAIHEAGHGLYEQGLVADQWALPLGEACSLGIHESQSLLWEKLVGRSHRFWHNQYPLLQRYFPDVLRDVSLEEFYRYVNRVQPSLIRINADEVTYSLHVILRFELEEALVMGKLEVAELRDAWNEKYRYYLGISPAHDAEGVLQDTHWYSGLIGYFPTYTLGAMAAAQLFETFCLEQGTDHLDRGDYETLLRWLREKIHQHGKRYDSQELILRATGKPLAAGSLLSYLRRKYLN